MCRLCHTFCERHSDSAASWLICSVVEDCCGGYAVCSCCAQTPVADEVHPECADDSNTSVRGAVHRPQLPSHLTPCAAGRRAAVLVVAELNPALVIWPHLHLSILSDVREALHVAETLQLQRAADGAGRHCATCCARLMVHQPHVEQRVRRHAGRNPVVF